MGLKVKSIFKDKNMTDTRTELENKLSTFTFGIVGLGIMGGSIAKAIRNSIGQNNFFSGKIIALDKNTESLESAKKEQIIDEGYLPEQNKIMLSKCDFVFICLYPHAILDFLKNNKNNFKDNAIITDISGVKALLEECYDEICPPNADFIMGHPMAGGEKEGFASSKGEFFINHNYILIDKPNNIASKIHKENFELFQLLIHKMGFSKITITDSDTHDNKIGFTSQLCHVVASAMVESAEDEQITSFGGGSFEDLTRIAMINAPLWTELFLSNKEKLVNHIENFKAQLDLMEEYIKNNKKDELQALLSDVRQKRIKMQKN